MKVLHGYIYPGYCITQLYLLGVVAGNLLNFVTYILISWAIVFVQLVLYHPQWGGVITWWNKLFPHWNMVGIKGWNSSDASSVYVIWRYSCFMRGPSEPPRKYTQTPLQSTIPCWLAGSLTSGSLFNTQIQLSCSDKSRVANMTYLTTWHLSSRRPIVRFSGPGEVQQLLLSYQLVVVIANLHEILCILYSALRLVVWHPRGKFICDLMQCSIVNIFVNW